MTSPPVTPPSPRAAEGAAPTAEEMNALGTVSVPATAPAGQQLVDGVRQRLNGVLGPAEVEAAIKDLFTIGTDGAYAFNFRSPYTSLFPEIKRGMEFPDPAVLQSKVKVPTVDGTDNPKLTVLMSQAVSINTGGVGALGVVLAQDESGKLWAVKIFKPETSAAIVAGGALSCALAAGAGLSAYGGCGRFPADYPDKAMQNAPYYLMAPIAFNVDLNNLPKKPDDVSRQDFKLATRLHLVGLPGIMARAVCHPINPSDTPGVLPYDFENRGDEFNAVVKFAKANAGKEVTLLDIIDIIPKNEDDYMGKIIPDIDLVNGHWKQE